MTSKKPSRKELHWYLSQVHDRSVRNALRRAIRGDGYVSAEEAGQILASCFDGKGVTAHEFRSIQNILRYVDMDPRGERVLGTFLRAFGVAVPGVPSAPAAPARPHQPAAPYTPPAPPALPQGQLTANFSLSEFACTDGTAVPSSYQQNAKDLAAELQKIRDHFGKAIRINSAYRTVSHNKKVGGKSNSQHLYCKAADIVVIGGTVDGTYDQIIKMIKDGDLKQGGVGRYNTFTHYDIRGKEARWDLR